MKICDRCGSSMSLWCDNDIKQLKESRWNIQAKNEELRQKMRYIVELLQKYILT